MKQKIINKNILEYIIKDPFEIITNSGYEWYATSRFGLDLFLNNNTEKIDIYSIYVPEYQKNIWKNYLKKNQIKKESVKTFTNIRVIIYNNYNALLKSYYDYKKEDKINEGAKKIKQLFSIIRGSDNYFKLINKIKEEITDYENILNIRINILRRYHKINNSFKYNPKNINELIKLAIVNDNKLNYIKQYNKEMKQIQKIITETDTIKKQLLKYNKIKNEIRKISLRIKKDENIKNTKKRYPEIKLKLSEKNSYKLTDERIYLRKKHILIEKYSYNYSFNEKTPHLINLQLLKEDLKNSAPRYYENAIDELVEHHLKDLLISI